MFCIARARFLPSSGRELLNQMKKMIGIVFANDAIGPRVSLVSTESPFGEYSGRVQFLVAPEQPKFRKIACCPTTQLLESLILTFVLVAPAGWISRFIGCLQFNECAGQRSLPHERDVWASYSLSQVFGYDDQS